VVLAVVDDQSQVDAGELRQESLLCGILLICGVTSRINDKLAALVPGIGVQAVKRLRLLRNVTSRPGHPAPGIRRRGRRSRCAGRPGSGLCAARREHISSAEVHPHTSFLIRDIEGW